MSDPNRLLVVSQPVLAAIGNEEIERAIPRSQRVGGWDLVEIDPVRARLGTLHEIDWAAAVATQERLIAERLQDEMGRRRRLAYFGFAPIPLALHLGYRVEGSIKVDVYQRHNGRQDWAWASDDATLERPSMKPLNLPEHGSMEAGPVVIRVSISERISPAETAEAVPHSLADVDVALTDPKRDALETKGSLDEVVKTFNLALSGLKRLFPNQTTIHLFAAVPVGLAFRLGTQINPTMYPEVMTYQYWSKVSPRYRKAIVLSPTEASSKEPVDWRGDELITGKQETFLDITFLHDGLRIAASVVRLGTWTQGGKHSLATGFLIARDTILTNYHVLYDGGRPVKQVEILFNYERDAAGSPRHVDRYEGDVATIDGDAAHDWAIIRPSNPFKDSYQALSLRPTKPVSKGDFVYIVQHPEGGLKKIGLLHNEVVHVTQDRVQYLTDTLRGSSGAPVCNEFWQVVALHHKGIEGDAAKGSDLKNQGIHIDRVVEGLTTRGILPPAEKC